MIQDPLYGRDINDLLEVEVTKTGYGILAGFTYNVRFRFRNPIDDGRVNIEMPDAVSKERMMYLRRILVQELGFEEIIDPYLPPEALNAKLIWRRK